MKLNRSLLLPLSVGAEVIGKRPSSVGTRIRHHRQSRAGDSLSENLGMRGADPAGAYEANADPRERIHHYRPPH